ncbi:MAG TPA: shikimate kinase [Bacillota bacterium]|nr:shikimate kinase [Bacillota bacterium]HPE37980.1 shikimate kinase [Bacillota bacterium]
MVDRMIVLVGMPGSGKSTVGAILASSLGVPFIDSDRIIMEKDGRRLQEIIDEEGLDYFMALEEKALLSLDDSMKVVATGGSAVLSEHGMAYLSSIATIVFLDVDIYMLTHRLANAQKRGIVIAKNQTIISLYHERKPYYQRYADIRIRPRNSRPRAVAEQIILAVEGRNTK